MSEPSRRLCQSVLFSILVLIVAASLAVARAQSDQRRWENVKQVAPGQETQVVLKNAKAYHGRLQSVSDESLVIHVARSDQTLRRESILRVSSKIRGHRTRNVLLCGAIGAGAGFVIGYALRGNSGDGADLIGPIFGPIIGAGAGAGCRSRIPRGGLAGSLSRTVKAIKKPTV